MSIDLITEVLFSGAIPFLALLLVADALRRRCVVSALAHPSLQTPAGVAGVAVGAVTLTYLLGTVAFMMGRVIGPGNVCDHGELFYVLQHASPAPSEAVMFGVRLVFINKALVWQVPFLGLASLYWVGRRMETGRIWPIALILLLSIAYVPAGLFLHREYTAWHRHQVTLAREALEREAPLGSAVDPK